MMKIIHLSDPHIHTNELFGINSVERFKYALEHIVLNHRDADMFAITGDITDIGDEDSYNLFKKIIKEFNLPLNLEPKLIPGNHDNRENFIKTLNHVPTDSNGFIQYYDDYKNNRFIFIDTLEHGTHIGHYPLKRQEWLIDLLNSTDDNKEIYIFMHHNPLALVRDESDGIGLKHKKEFKEILISKKNIKHIFFGHQHITSSGSYLGISFSSPRSTWSPLIPNFSSEYRLGLANTDPNYNVAILNKNGIVIHTEDFLKTDIKWLKNE